MEWVQTTGRTVDEAKEHALDQLGVDETEAEFEVLAEASSSLFGLRKSDARVRARVRPQQAQAKTERRNRPARGKARDRGARDGRSKAGVDKKDKAVTRRDGSGNKGPADAGTGKTAAVSAGGSRESGQQNRSNRSAPSAAVTAETSEKSGDLQRGSKDADAADHERSRSQQSHRDEETKSMSEEEQMSVETQVEIVEDFVAGLGEAFGFDVEVSSETLDDDFVEVQVEGDDLGLMIGPKGATLQAIQELSRTVAQRQSPGPLQGRVRLDVSGYRQRRREALGRFATQVADQVLDSGERRALEPMGAADRKVVHDTINEIDGVRTTSEGEEPRRRVVLMPDD